MNENKVVGHDLVTVEPSLESLTAAVQQLYSLYQQECRTRQELELKVANLKKRVEDAEADNDDLYNAFLALKKKVTALSMPTPPSINTTPFSPFAAKSAFANAPRQPQSRVDAPIENACPEPTQHAGPDNSSTSEVLPEPVPASVGGSASQPSTGRFFSIGAAGQRMLQNALQACVKQVVTRAVTVAENAHDQVRPADRPGRLFYSRTRLLQLRPSRADTYSCQHRLPPMPGLYVDLSASDAWRRGTGASTALTGGAENSSPAAAHPRMSSHTALAAPHTDKQRGRVSSRPVPSDRSSSNTSSNSYAHKLVARYGVLQGLRGLGDRADADHGMRGRNTGPKREPAPLVDVEGHAITREELAMPLQRAAERWVPRALRSQSLRPSALSGVSAPTTTTSPMAPEASPDRSAAGSMSVVSLAPEAAATSTAQLPQATDAPKVSTDPADPVSPAASVPAATAEAEATLQLVLSTVRSKLNKLTEMTLPKFTVELAQLLAQLHTQAAVAAVAKLVYLKSIQDPAFCPLYAELCAGIHAQLQSLLSVPRAPEAPLADTFRRELVNACQAAFTQLLAQHAASGSAPVAAQMTPQQARGLGRLIGELYKVRLLRLQAVLAVLEQELDLAEDALRSVPPRVPDEDLEALLQLLRSVGAAVDTDKGVTPELSAVVERVYERLRALTHSGSGLTTRMRFLVLDVVELRARAWRPAG